MASEVDIANLALSHLGDSATVASLDPPEGSAQAEHCARWYPIARNALLELHDWNFATSRVKLAQVTQNWSEWAYAYAYPSDVVRLLAVLPEGATSDNSTSNSGPISSAYGVGYYDDSTFSVYMPQPYTSEVDEAGNRLIYTNEPSATLRYTRIITDTTKFSQLFVTTLARFLASYLAGPVLKGDTGIQIGAAQLRIAMEMMSKAAVSDSNQMRQPSRQSVSWIAGR